MKSHRELSNEEFLKQFRSCEMDESLFNHEAHLRLAWINIRQDGIERAVESIPNQIMAYVDHLGVRSIYNHTLTVAAVKVIYHFMLKSDSDDFTAFMDEFPRLTSNFKQLIEAHYSADIYTNDQAKAQFVEPNLLPFDI